MQLFYELSAADLGAAQRLFSMRRRATAFWMTTIYGVAAMLFGLFDSFIHRPGFLIPLLAGLYLVLQTPVLLPRAARKNWVKSRALHGAATLSTSSEGLTLETPHARFFYRWDVVLHVDEGATVWIVCVSPLSFVIIPTRAFGSEEEKSRLRAELSRIGAGAQSSVAPPLAAP